MPDNTPQYGDSTETLLAKILRQIGATAGTADWGGLSGDITDQDDLVTYITGRITASVVWGAITGTLTNQTDLTAYVSERIALALAGLGAPKGPLNASTNPNYPAAVAGDYYYISVGGKVGGASGKDVSAGDCAFCFVTGAAGTDAAVGANWTIVNTNIPGLTTLGVALATLATPAGVRFLQINADGTITQNTAAQALTAIGAETAGAAATAQAAAAGDATTKANAAQAAAIAAAAGDATTKANAAQAAAISTASGDATTKAAAAQAAAIAAAAITAANADNLTSGTVAIARLVNTQVVGDANAAITAGKRDVLLTAALTAARTFTLPAASGYPAGARVTFSDIVGTITSSNTATLTAAGSDTVNGAASITLTTANASVLLISDGTSKWNLDIRGITRGGTGATTAAAARTNLGVPPISLVGSPCEIQFSVSDETTALTAGTAKITFRMPYAMNLTAIRGSLVTAQTSGSIFTADINEAGTSVISTKLTIDNTEKTTTTAATPAVISDSSLADDAEITVDIDQIGDGTAKGFKLAFLGTRA